MSLTLELLIEKALAGDTDEGRVRDVTVMARAYWKAAQETPELGPPSVADFWEFVDTLDESDLLRMHDDPELALAQDPPIDSAGFWSFNDPNDESAS